MINLLLFECIAMMFAGHDTTAHTLTWLLVETSRNDTINENIIKEIR
jgi:cytochrome P450